MKLKISKKNKEICISNRKGEIKTNRRQIHVAQCKFQKEHRENGKETLFKIIFRTFYILRICVSRLSTNSNGWGQGTFTQGHIMKLQNVEDKKKILKLYREEPIDLAIQKMEYQKEFSQWQCYMLQDIGKYPQNTEGKLFPGTDPYLVDTE